MSSEAIKTKKKLGPIRWNAIIPFIILTGLAYLYFVLFFDSHMKSAIEWVGFKANGAEVNIAQFKSSFLKGKIQISKIQVTNPENPDFNSIELGDVRFDLNWDALLRVKFVVEEMAVENVQLNSKRVYRGKVAPPEPESNEPSLVSQLQAKALNKLEGENKNNLIGDISAFLKSGKVDEQIGNIQSQLNSKKLLDETSAKWKGKQSEWQTNLKTLPTAEDIGKIKKSISELKYQDFKTIDELNLSVKAGESIIADLNAKNQKINDLKKQFDDDLKLVDSDKKAIEKQIKDDIDTLKARFKIPKIDAANFAKEMFMGYLTPYLSKLDKYKATAKKYLPPKYAKMVDGEKSPKEDETIQPIPRSKGVTYEFPVKNGYPLVWLQKISLSSKSNSQTDLGDIDGLIENVTTNQSQIGKSTTAKIKGEFKSKQISGIELNANLDNRKSESVVNFDFKVGSYPLTEIVLLNSNDGQISIPATNVNLIAQGEVLGFEKYKFNLVNTFNSVKFDIKAADQTLDEVLKNTLGLINTFDLQADLQGQMKEMELHIKSSLGSDLEKAFQNLLQNKINEANQKLQLAINSEVDKLKTQFNEQIDAMKKQAETEIKKIQTQVDEQKKLVDQRLQQAKKDFEDQVAKAKKDAEDQAKKQVEDAAKKQADDLKKKLGL